MSKQPAVVATRPSISSGSGSVLAPSNPQMEQLVPVFAKLQEVLNMVNGEPIDLPQIIVVGSQSAGKSSVLENIVTRDFLPRGNDIVTRCPLILRLVNTSLSRPATSGRGAGEKDSATEWAEFSHLPEQVFKDFTKVRAAIEEETNRLAGANQAISSQPIFLTVYSPYVVNLTLVDLPGLTKNPVGDQPPDIELQIRKVLLDYASNPNAIILAVSAANVDLANSDALKFAREVDPDGKRTIGVLTKLDLMDAGTDALDALLGKIYPLKHGFIGIVSRSQADIISGKSIREALKSESDFFANKTVYRSVLNRCGSTVLARTLNQLLVHHIWEKLPEIRSRIVSMTTRVQSELDSYGESPIPGKMNKNALVLNLLTQFAADFCNSVDGTSRNISTSELSGGARISRLFHEAYQATLDDLDPCGGLSVQEIRTAIRNSSGPRPSSLFVSEATFDLLAKKQIKRLEDPSKRCAELVYEELIRVIHANHGEKGELKRFPLLHARCAETVIRLLKERRGPTMEMIESMVQIELAYINTNHPDFLMLSSTFSEEMTGLGLATNLDKKSSLAKPSATNPPSSGVSPNFRSGSVVSVAGSGASASSAPSSTNPAASLTSSVSNGIADANNQTSGGFLHNFFGGNGAVPNSGAAGHIVTRHRASSGYSAASHAAFSHWAANQRSLLHARHAEQQGKDNRIRLENFSGSTDDALKFDDSEYMSEREVRETELIRSLIASYFSVVRKQLQDSVPKAIMHFLVNNVKENVQNRLVTELYREEFFNDLLREDEQVEIQRSRCQTTLEALRKANAILMEIKEINVNRQ